MKRSRYVRHGGLVLVLVLALTGAACSRTRGGARGDSGDALLPGDQPVEHPVHSAKLLAAMRDLENLTLDALPANLESDATVEARAAEVWRIANAIAAEATRLPEILNDSDLPPEETRQFRLLAERLHTDALSLRDRAAASRVGTAREEAEVLLATCNACHAEFRDRVSPR